MKISDIEQIPRSYYNINVSWGFLDEWIEHNNKPGFIKTDMSPSYQRGYKWTEEQKIAYIEFIMRGGESGRDIYWNCPTWMNFKKKDNVIELVDRKQRLNAVRQFLNNEVKAYGHYYEQFEDCKIIKRKYDFIFHIGNIKNRADILKWYIGMNTGGSVHSEKDLEPAYEELKKEEFLKCDWL